jgi:CBS domain-containing membrane protein
MQVQQIMRRDFVCSAPEEPLEEARQTMRLARLRHMLVTRGDALVGILSYRDLLERLDARVSSGACVGDAMQRAPLAVGPDASLGEAADRMCRYGYGCLPVVEGGDRLVGILTETDLLRAAYRL